MHLSILSIWYLHTKVACKIKNFEIRYQKDKITLLNNNNSLNTYSILNSFLIDPHLKAIKNLMLWLYKYIFTDKLTS